MHQILPVPKTEINTQIFISETFLLDIVLMDGSTYTYWNNFCSNSGSYELLRTQWGFEKEKLIVILAFNSKLSLSNALEMTYRSLRASK